SDKRLKAIELNEKARQRELSSRSDAEANHNQTTGVESNVTRLLVSIKKLLEGLTDWSNGAVTDAQISDMYVRLGNDFNAAVIAFDGFGIDMGRVPDELRDILETCLTEEASPENLALYLPGVRKIITRLLEGLRKKQDEYRLRDGSGTRSRRTSRGEAPQSDDPGPREESTGQTARSTSSRSSQRRTNSASMRQSDIPVPPIPQTESGQAGPSSTRSPSQKRMPISRSASATPAPPDTDSETPRKTSPRTPRQIPGTLPTSPSPEVDAPLPSSKPEFTQPHIPPEVPRYSLQDTPLAPFSVEVTSPTTPDAVAEQRPETPEGPSTPAVEQSLAALKQSETLQRRASKRFSTYTMSKMAGTGLGSVSSASNALRRSMAAGALLTPGDLTALTEVDENAEDSVITTPRPNRDLARKRSLERRQRMPTLDEVQPPVPSLPDVEGNAAKSLNASINGTANTLDASKESERPESPRELTVYFQVGRQVKKVMMEPVTSFAALRVLFMNKFLYNPGSGNFPEIYIRDPASGVQYELEDVSEIKDKCLLSLNIEPLDQIKQHIDSQISNLSQEIKDLKQSVATSRRMSLPMAPPSPGLVNNVVLSSRPTERQFQSVAQRIGKAQARSATSMAPLVPQMTGGSDAGSVAASRIVADLKSQFDEVQNIRRDLGVMRQIYVDFTNSTKESLASLRAQATSVRQVANTKIGGARASIDSGKARLDKRSQDVLTEIEDLQDTVENLKDDVLKRHINPRFDVMKRLRTKIDSTTKELEDLKNHIATIRPGWKKTWEQELQNIVEEQQFLSHQEELIEDLYEDHKALAEVFGHVEKVITIRGKSGPSRSFRPPPVEEGHGGLSTVMLEIRGARVESDKRLKAIELNEKARQREL
ncbi:16688_t:CDS:2, partial [Acaulospora colombiana]